MARRAGEQRRSLLCLLFARIYQAYQASASTAPIIFATLSDNCADFRGAVVIAVNFGGRPAGPGAVFSQVCRKL